MYKTTITKQEAIGIILRKQLLDAENRLTRGRNGILQIINQLGYIQIDTISVINRAHHHILWTRKNDYNENHIHKLQAKDKLIFEYWAHAMSYLPINHYRFSLQCMENFRSPNSKWLKYRYNQSGKYFTYILERITNEGPLSSSDFQNEDGKKRGTWWDWKPAKTALEYLFWQGDLMVAERKGFQKYYDLTERVLPSDIDTTKPSNDELAKYFVRKALSASGIASETEIMKFMQPGKTTVSDLQVVDRSTMKKAIAELCEDNEIVPLAIEGEKQIINYSLKKTLVNNKNKIGKQIHFLSPFDNLIIQRERLKRLFNFNYVIECYVPEPKRVYGYFVLPVLYGNKFVARFDPKADRKKNILLINNLVFENNINDYDEILPLFAEKLIEFANFNNCNNIKIVKSKPVKIKSVLKKHILKQYSVLDSR